jgi:hypothetical protein
MSHLGHEHPSRHAGEWSSLSLTSEARASGRHGRNVPPIEIEIGYSITSSARQSSIGGTSMPIAFADQGHGVSMHVVLGTGHAAESIP